jgi:hypothetical protein
LRRFPRLFREDMPARLNPVLGKKFHPADPVSKNLYTSIRWGWCFGFLRGSAPAFASSQLHKKFASAVF